MTSRWDPTWYKHHKQQLIYVSATIRCVAIRQSEEGLSFEAETSRKQRSAAVSDIYPYYYLFIYLFIYLLLLLLLLLCAASVAQWFSAVDFRPMRW